MDDPKQKFQHFKRLGRELAMQYLFHTDLKGADTQSEYDIFWEGIREQLELEDDRFLRKARKYAERLVLGIKENLAEIDQTISGFSEKWDINRMAVVDRNIIRVAVYEMKFLPDIPPVVSIDEAVGIAKEFSSEKSGLFINGVLNAVKDSLQKSGGEVAEES
ncbi:MAG: transcription antitermination factor NusB [Lentisphaerae bacterium GWF2_45_14]|nr:MAG: transcription antitermination factor NusB [Lentisphaerae bacterium GWF2_45_14]